MLGLLLVITLVGAIVLGGFVFVFGWFIGKVDRWTDSLGLPIYWMLGIVYGVIGAIIGFVVACIHWYDTASKVISVGL